MDIRFPCSNCKLDQRAPQHLAGRELSCQSCGQPFTVPKVAVPTMPAVNLDASNEDDIFGEYQRKPQSKKKA